MNSLNSVLIEGTVAESAEGAGEYLAILAVATASGDIQVTFRAVGRLAQICAEALKLGRGVRVVGRLAVKEAQVYIVAEHIEIMPMQAKP
jgi:hypothetical protein